VPSLLALALSVAAALAAIWLPLWWHWRVVPLPVPAPVVEQHRQLPDERVLAIVAETSMTTDHPLRGAAAVAAARRLLRGELALPHLPVIPIDIGFARRDLSRGVPVQQIFTASLIVPDLLLRAYEHEADPAFVAAALRYTRGFAEFESGVLWPRDYERNSHATANRASVLARLWRHVRHAPGYEARTGEMIHAHAQRLAALLRKPETFIAPTNHGVMQNIALLQLSTAFPALPGAAAYRELALQRLALQLPGYIGEEGAVLEHAAGYHFHGVVLSGHVLALLDAAGEPVPAAWRAAHGRARDFLATLQRPDRTLPSYGNTFRYAWALPPLHARDAAASERDLRQRASFARLFPTAGYAVWWDATSAAGAATHTTMPWGFFAGHGHRRAQELSLLVWAAGTEWSGNSGYWPGDDLPGVHASDGWDGGNGPHVVAEAADERRRSRLRASAEGEGLRFVDVERESPAGDSAPPLRVRRQLLQWQGSSWIALDTYADAQRRALRVLWTAAPETTQRQTGAATFRHEREGSPVAMTLSIAGSDGVDATPLRGSRQPFGGWVAFDRRAAPAPSVDARLPAQEGWMLATLDLHPPTASPLRSRLLRWGSAQDWTLELVRAAGARIEVTRVTDALLVREHAGASTEGGDVQKRLPLVAGADNTHALAAIARARTELLAAHPRVPTHDWLRLRYTQALLVAGAVAAALVVAAALLARRRGRRLNSSAAGRSRRDRS
jgi:hypothetical protein